MFKTYDTTQAAYVEHSGKYYDLQLKAWVDVPSAKTYDTAEAAWIERMYAGYFALSNDSNDTLLQSGDILDISNNGFVFNTFSKNLSRRCKFELPYKWTKGDIVEFDVVTNSRGYISVSMSYYYLKYGTQEYESSKSGTSITGEHNEHITFTITSNVPSTYDGWEVSRSDVSILALPIDTTGEFYSEVKNFTINGKKYGFTE